MNGNTNNPRITFSSGYDGSQPVHIVYTDYNSYREPAGLKIVGNTSKSSSPAWLEIEGDLITNGNIYYPALAANKIIYANTNKKIVTMTNSVIGTNSLIIGDAENHEDQSYVKAQNKNGAISVYTHSARGLYNHGGGPNSHTAGWLIAANTLNETFINSCDDNKDIFFAIKTTKKGRFTATGNMVLMNKERGYFLTDSAGNEYPGVYDNGSNLWIGSKQTKEKHHVGGTYISTGYNGTAGNTTIKVSVPNSTNSDGTNYDVYHSGMIIPTSNGGTGNSTFDANRVIYSSSATKLSSSGHYSSSNKMAINSTSEPT